MMVPTGVALFNLGPRIHLGLLHSEADFLFVLVDLKHDHIHLAPDLNKLAGVIDATRPGHLGDVHQAFNSIFDFHEGPVRHDIHDFAAHTAANGVLLLNLFPRRRLKLLQAQCDPVPLPVEAQHLHFELLLEGHALARVIHTAPRHVRDMQQAVNATNVEERSEIGDVLDRFRCGSDLPRDPRASHPGAGSAAPRATSGDSPRCSCARGQS